MNRCLVVMLLFAVGMLSKPPDGFAQRNPPPTVLKIKIEAPELDKRILLDKLQSHGTDNGLRFESVEQNFDYRIVFATGQRPVMTAYGEMNASAASADVYDFDGKELFKFDRKARGTDEGATNAVAKEIVKRLLQWRSLTAPK